jgi:hypothetical protein
MPISPASIRYLIDTRTSQFTVHAFASRLVSAIGSRFAIEREVHMASSTLEGDFSSGGRETRLNGGAG